MNRSLAVEFERPKRAGSVIQLALRLYRRYPLLFLVLALGVIGPWDVAVLVIVGNGTPSPRAAVIVTVLGWVVIAPLVSALHVHAVADIREGQEPHLLSVAKRGLLVLPVVAAATIASGLAIAVGFLFLIVPGIFLWLRWYVVAQATAVAEGGGWFEGLGRSWRLTEGNGRHIFAFVGLSILVFIALGIASSAVDEALSGAPEFIAGVVLDTISASFVALTTACLYYDLVVRSSPAAWMSPRDQLAERAPTRAPAIAPPRADEPATEFQIELAQDDRGRDWEDLGTARGAEPEPVEQALLTTVKKAGVYRVRPVDAEEEWEYYFVVPETGHVHRRAPL